MRRQHALLGLLAVWLAAMLTFDYYVRIEEPEMQARMSLHHMIVDGTAPYQYRYRILIPYAAEGLGRLFQHAPRVNTRAIVPPLTYSKRAFVLAYALLNWVALVIMLWAVGALIARLTRFDLAPFGVALSAMMIEFTFRQHYFHPWSFWEGAFFALGLLLIHARKYWAFSALSLAALLNRETSIFLLVAFVCIELPRGPGLRFAIGSLAAWVAGYFAIHALVGYAPATFFVGTALEGNRANLWFSLWLNLLIIGIPLPLIWRGLERSSPFIRRAALALPAYLALLLVIGYWWEIRYWITALPIIVPAIAAAAADVTP